MYIFPICVYHEFGYIKTFIPKSMFFQLFNVDKRLSVFALSASGLGLISSIWVDGRKVIQSVK